MAKLAYTKQERLPLLDLIRIFSIISVILIHTTSRSLEQGGYDLQRLPWPFVLNIVARFAVPMFFLLSGLVLGYRYQKRISPIPFYRKHILKIFVPYVLWSLFFYFVVLGNSVKQILSVDFVINLFFKGELYFHLYFIPALIFLYLLFPLLNKYLFIFKNPTNILFLTILQLFLLSLEYYGDSLHILPAGIRIFLLNLYIFSYGIVIGKHYEAFVDYCRKRLVWLITILIISLGTMIYESYRFYYSTANVAFVVEQWRSTVYIYTFSLFAVFTYIFHNKLNLQRKFLQKISSISFFVYFFHVLSITVFWRFLGSYLFSKTQGHVVETVWFNVLVFTFVCISSFLVALLLNRLPRWKWIIGLQG